MQQMCSDQLTKGRQAPRAHRRGQLQRLRPEFWTQHSGCSADSEWPLGVRGGADYMLSWAPEPQPWSALNKGQPQGRASRQRERRELLEQPGPEHKGVCAETVGKDKGTFCSALETGFSALGTVSLEQWPSCAERSVCGTKNGSCSLKGGLEPVELSKQPPPHHSHDHKEALNSPETRRATHPSKMSPLQAVAPERGRHSPLQAVPLVQCAQGSVWVLVMEVDGGSHQQERGIGHIHTPAHLSV